MKRAKLISAALGTLMTLGGAGLANAKIAHHPLHALTGKITSLNRAKRQITVASGTKSRPHGVKVTVAAKTAIKLHKKRGTFASLKVGDHVHVSPSATHATQITDLGHGHHHHKALKK